MWNNETVEEASVNAINKYCQMHPLERITARQRHQLKHVVERNIQGFYEMIDSPQNVPYDKIGMDREVQRIKQLNITHG